MIRIISDSRSLFLLVFLLPISIEKSFAEDGYSYEPMPMAMGSDPMASPDPMAMMPTADPMVSPAPEASSPAAPTPAPKKWDVKFALVPLSILESRLPMLSYVNIRQFLPKPGEEEEDLETAEAAPPPPVELDESEKAEMDGAGKEAAESSAGLLNGLRYVTTLLGFDPQPVRNVIFKYPNGLVKSPAVEAAGQAVLNELCQITSEVAAEQVMAAKMEFSMEHPGEDPGKTDAEWAQELVEEITEEFGNRVEVPSPGMIVPNCLDKAAYEAALQEWKSKPEELRGPQPTLPGRASVALGIIRLKVQQALVAKLEKYIDQFLNRFKDYLGTNLQISPSISYEAVEQSEYRNLPWVDFKSVE